MRKALFGILMAATASVPAVAQAQDSDSRESRRAEARAERTREHYQAVGERNQARSERRQEAQTERVERRQEAQTQRVERQQVRQERVEAAPVQQQQQSWSRRSGGDSQRSQAWTGQRGQRSDGGDRSGYQRDIEASREASQRSADQTIGGNYARQAQRNQERYEQRAREDRRDGRDWNRDGRDGRNDRWSDNRDSRRSSWSRNWRSDNRYDWQRYRYSNRNLFRSGGYYSPYRGYSYNRLNIGFILDSLFYSNRYWLSDPYQYRLPPAPYGTQWVRYYDDVVLVDVYTGEVLDVIYDFFW
jgi:Nickel/cobalt transporter regulator